jgi:hypothetical protein
MFTPHLQAEGTLRPGWSINPLLHICVVALAGPVHLGESPGIGPEQRDALREQLRAAPATQRLRSLAALPAAFATGEPGEAPATSPSDWEATPTPYQSSGLASYRLGGEAVTGVSSLASVQLPSATKTNAVTLTVDSGLSLLRPLTLLELGQLVRDCLLLATGPMFDAMSDVLPSHAVPFQAEVYIAAVQYATSGEQRGNDLAARVDLTPLGDPSRPLTSLLSYAAEVGGPLVELEASELVMEALRMMALDSGYLDPRIGLEQLRGALGLPRSSPA